MSSFEFQVAKATNGQKNGSAEESNQEPNKINWKSTVTMVLDSIDLYAEQWTKREQVYLKCLSE